jgi:hypothetical protein
MKRMRIRSGALHAALLVLAATAPGCAWAQEAEEGTPAWVVERFYGREAFPERGEYLGGELAQFREARTPGSALPEGARVTVRPLRVHEDRAVVAVTVATADTTTDAYVYLNQNQGRWQITAFRALALPPLFFMAMDELRALPARTPEDERMLRNMQLTAASDSALKAYFVQHRPAIEALGRAAAQAGEVTWLGADPADGEGTLFPALLRIREQLRALDMEAVGRDRKASGCVLLHIGGMIDNSVGYLHAPRGCQVPEMTPGGFIYVEEIAPGWYLYKTT